jgi:hypothetical protein
VVGKLEEKRPLEKPTRRWEANVKLNLIGSMGLLDRIHFVLDIT